MIVTLTPNPSVDRTMSFERIALGDGAGGRARPVEQLTGHVDDVGAVHLVGEHERHADGLLDGRPAGFANFDQWLSGTELERELKIREYSVSNRGLRPGFVGTPETVRARIEAFEAVGLDLVLLQMSPQEEEMGRFAAQVIQPTRPAG